MKDVVEFHEKKEANATIVLQQVKDPRRFGLVKFDTFGKVIDIIEKIAILPLLDYWLSTVPFSAMLRRQIQVKIMRFGLQIR